MEQILYKKTYQEYKAELDTELSKTAEGFVRIGYLLKVARDTNVLEESPYQTVTEFAKAEYGIDKTMVSRFISINDRFSEGGYSDQLQEQYRSYGYAKLTLMLTLPDEINQELSPSYSKTEIQAIKDEVDEEKAISDLEVMLEPHPVPAPAEGLLNMLIRQLGEDSPELYLQMTAIMDLEDQQEWTRKAKETLAPDAEKQYSIRISGTGRFLVSIRESEDTITTTSLRSLEKASYTYQDLRDAWSLLIPTGESAETDYRETWEKLYHKEFPGKAKVAPVQQPGKPKKTESKPLPRKESKVQKAPKPGPTKETPPAKKIPPAPELEKPESTSTEPIPEEPERTAPEAASIVPEPEREPQESEQPTQEPEMTKSTSKELLLHPGMRVRNTGKIADHPAAEGTIIRQGTYGVWWIKYDGYSDSCLIAPSEVKNLEIIDDQSEQLPGQIGTEEAIAEAKERQGAVSYIEPEDPTLAAGQEPEPLEDTTVAQRNHKEMDREWLREKQKFANNFEPIKYNRLATIKTEELVAVREHAINIAALIERELLYRGEKF